MRCPLLKVLYFLARFAIIGLRPMTYYQKEGDWLIPKDEKHFETIIAPLCEVKPAFKEFLGEEMLRFGGALRAHVADIVRERPHLAKSEVCEKFGFSSRVYNLVVNMGDAACSSATELLEDDRQKKTERLETLVDEAAKIEEKIAAQERSWQARRELGDERAAYKQTAIAELKKKLKYKQKAIFYARRKLDNLPTRPHVFLGGKALYYSQPGKGATQEEREAWRWEYLAARNRVCGARGSADEKGGNSTYQLAYVKDITRSIKVLGRKNVYTVMKFSVAFGGEVVTSVCLPEKEGRQLKAILDINNEKMLYEEVMTEDENPRTVKRAITTGRTALKITFMRDWRNDLRIYISYPIAGKPKPMAILGSIGIDINYGHCESLEVGLAGGKIKWVAIARTSMTETPRRRKRWFNCLPLSGRLLLAPQNSATPYPWKISIGSATSKRLKTVLALFSTRSHTGASLRRFAGSASKPASRSASCAANTLLIWATFWRR